VSCNVCGQIHPVRYLVIIIIICKCKILFTGNDLSDYTIWAKLR